MLIAFHGYDDNNMGLSYWWHVDNIEIYPYVTSSVVKEYHIYRNGEKIGTSADCSFTDQNPGAGTNIYKVKAVGDFGETIFSNEYSVDVATGVAEHAVESDIRLDVRRDVIHVNGSQVMTGVSLYDLRGNLVYQDKMYGANYTIHTSTLQQGLYVLLVYDQNHRPATYKIIH